MPRQPTVRATAAAPADESQRSKGHPSEASRQRAYRRSRVAQAFARPELVFLITITLRLATFAFLPELEAIVGMDAWVAHPSLSSVDFDYLQGALPHDFSRAAVAAASGSAPARWSDHHLANLSAGVSSSSSSNSGGAPTWLRPFKRTTPAGIFYSHFNAEEMTPSFPYRFSATIPPLEAAIWRDVVFLKQQLVERRWRTPGRGEMLESMDVLLPDYLRSLAPWYAQYIPPWLAQQPWTVLVLSLFDGIVAAMCAACFPSTDTMLLYVLFVANPFTVAACVYESLQPLEMLLLTFIVDATRRAGRWWRGDDDMMESSNAESTSLAATTVRRLLFLSAAIVASVFLGSSYLGVTVALLFPMGMRSRRLTLLAAVGLTVFVGIYALGYGFLDTHEKLPVGEEGTGSALTTALGLHDYARRAELSTLYAPIDNGVLWYVRQVVLPAFEENLALVMLQVPAMAMIPLCMLMPDVGRYVDAYKRMCASGQRSAVGDQMIEPLFKDTKVFTVIFATLTSFLFRNYFNIAYMLFGLLLLYSNVNGKATERVRLDADSEVAPAVRTVSRLRGAELAAIEAELARQKPTIHSAHERARIIVPLYMLITFTSVQLGLYVTYCIYEVSNANWLFFSSVGVTLADTFFLVAWLDTFAEDIVKIERQVEGW